MRLLPIPLIALSACLVSESEHQAALAEQCLEELAEQVYVDVDGDGLGALVTAARCEGSVDELEALFASQVESGGDCDDADPEVGEGSLYQDADGDGYGDALIGAGCEPGAGESLAGGDCDDSDGAAYPGAPESCDGLVDEDCDGAVDEGFATSAWFPDADGDGFGAGPGEERCAGLSGEVERGGDCDDGDPWTYPGAEERVGDAVDGDCDGAVDQLAEAAWACDGPCALSWTAGSAGVAVGDSAAGEAWLLAADAEGFTELGAASGAAGFGAAVVGLGGEAWAVGSPEQGDGEVTWFEGAAERGRVEGGGGYSGLGAALGGGDGVLLIQAAIPDFSQGAVLLFEAPSGANNASSYDARVAGFAEPTQPFALELVALDGDGVADDVLVGAPDENSGGGGVFLFSGLERAGSVSVNAGVGLSGGGREALGLGVAAADFDGDGGLELALAGQGVVYLLDAPPSEGDRVVDLASATLSGTPAAPALSAADLDGDGHPELVVGGDPDRLWALLDWPAGARSLESDALELPASEPLQGALAGEPGGAGLALTTDNGVSLVWGAE